MTEINSSNPFVELSEAMVAAVSKAGASTLMVAARRRMPASGIAYAPDLVLTANHVVERDDDIQITLPDGTDTRASLAGRDPGSDMALLRLDGDQMMVSEIAAEEAKIGQLVLALGRPSREGIQASLGVVGRINGPVRLRGGGLLERYLTTDTIPYPGFSGGPLIDASGCLLGINTSGLTHGASLTIPTSLAWGVAEALAQHGQVRRGFLGIRSQPVELPAIQQQVLEREQAIGLLLVGVDRDSPAARAGLLVGDILVGFAGQPILDPDDLLPRLIGDVVGSTVEIEILRGEDRRVVPVIIGERRS